MTIPTRDDAKHALQRLLSSSDADERTHRFQFLRSYIEFHTGEPVGYTGSGSLAALSKGADGYIWPSPAAAHPVPLYTSPVQPDPITAHQVIEFMERETGLPFGDFIGITDKERIKAMAASIGDK